MIRVSAVVVLLLAAAPIAGHTETIQAGQAKPRSVGGAAAPHRPSNRVLTLAGRSDTEAAAVIIVRGGATAGGASPEDDAFGSELGLARLLSRVCRPGFNGDALAAGFLPPI